MKHLTLFLCTFWYVSFAGCTQDDTPPVYSCDEKVDAWVKANLSQIRTLTRSDWKKLPMGVDLAVYRAFSSTQQKEFWQDKFKEVKLLPWSSAEKAHIKKAEQFLLLHNDYFEVEELSTEQLDVLDTFFYKWTQDGINHLGWKPEIAYSIAASGRSLINTKGELESRPDSISPILRSSLETIEPFPINPTKPGGSTDFEQLCHCKVNNLFACFPTVDECIKGKCNSKARGCGWVLFEDCDGLCNGM